MSKAEKLIKFEEEIAKLYEAAKIRSPIHLSKGNEKKLIRIFKDFKDGDWVFSTHRSHYHWLLSGRDREELKQQILEGHSMHIFGDKFFTSAIVGGNAPIALGVAAALKLKNSPNKVWCFVGDASYECGIVQECIKYAQGHNLPVTFIVEDNGYCVIANTKQTWGTKKAKVLRKYKYSWGYPHAGTGKYVMF